MTLFLNRFGGRLSQRSIQEKVRRYSVKAALPSGRSYAHAATFIRHPHMLRGRGGPARRAGTDGDTPAPLPRRYTPMLRTAQAKQVYMDGSSKSAG